MDEVRYMISEAAKHVGVEAHVLRNWEKELALPIPRNEMDQRYYKDSDIELLKKIKQMKASGFGLKAIKMSLNNPKLVDSFDSDSDAAPKKEANEKVIELFPEDKQLQQKDGTSLIPETEDNKVKEEPNAKLGQFKAIMNHIILSALKENNGVLTEEISENVTDGVIREMNYLMRLQEEKEEERFRKFDATLREYQKSKMMAAAAIDKKRNKSKFLKKNKIYI